MRIFVFALSFSFLLLSCGDDPAGVASGDDVAAVEAAKAALTTANFTFSGADTGSSVTQAFTAPETADGGVTLSWSTTSELIRISGTTVSIVRYTLADANATITATLSKGSYSTTKDLALTLKAGTLYMAGSDDSTGGAGVPGYWTLGGSFTALSHASTGGNQAVHAAAFDNGDIYFAGEHTDTVYKPCYWKNGTRTTLSALDSMQHSSATGIAVTDGHVYVVGYSGIAGTGETRAGVWLDGAWTALDCTQEGGTECVATGIVIHDGSVFVSGHVRDGSSQFVPGYWEDGTWNALSRIDSGKSSFANAIHFIDDNLYIAGSSMNSSWTEQPVYWLNGTRTVLAQIVSGNEGVAYAITSSGGIPYFSGYNLNGSSKQVAGYWTGGTWFPGDLVNDYHRGYSIVVSGSDVYVGGKADDGMGGSDFSGYWKNSTWHLLDGNSGNNTINAFLIGPPL